MFSQLLFVRLRAAEQALRGGRIDEAHRLALSPDLRAHRRGAAVLSTLSELFLERARTHFRADRFREALLDLDRAESGGVLRDEIAQLRRDIQAVASAVYQRDEARRARLEAARRKVSEGLVDAGRRLLEEASSGDLAAEKLRRELESRSAESSRLAMAAETELRLGHLASAAKRLHQAKGLDAASTEVSRVEALIVSQALNNAREAFRDGRLARVEFELAAMDPLGAGDPRRAELETAFAAARSAAASFGAARFADARRRLLSLQSLVPEAVWLTRVAELLGQLDELHEAVSSGPLGFPTAGTDRDAGATHPDAADDAIVVRASGASATALPERMLLLVDGGGSYLVVRGAAASVGRAAADHPADVPLLGDIAERHANITRVDDDYFIFAAKDVEVAGKPTRHQLLRDGDRVVLGRKAKFTFRSPSRRSATAVLDLSDTTKMPNDVRRVVLFQGHATIGEGQHAHIRCRHAGPPLLLFERNGRMWIRQHNDGHVDGGAAPMELGRPVEIGGARLVLNTWQVRGRTL